MINIPSDDKVMAFINTKDLKDDEYVNSHCVVMCAKKGVVKKTNLESYSRPRQNGINAIQLEKAINCWRQSNNWKFTNYASS